ncbi:MAG: response regulator, partial [Promethearchaeota archaeon]
MNETEISVIIISKDNDLTNKMKKYEKETGKKAKWRGNTTEGFKKWLEGEKVYGIDKKGIGILVSEKTKTDWEKFAGDYGFSTISRLIRKAVNFYIDFTINKRDRNDFSKFSHDLKEPLTSIQGFLQLIIENEAGDLKPDILVKINDVYTQSLLLENKINEIIGNHEEKSELYDILIVEDDRFTITVLNEYFESKGYKIMGVQTGVQGLEELKKFKPKLILLDIILPDINGYEICRKIKTDSKLKSIPVYYITAVPEADVQKNMEETGADGF